MSTICRNRQRGFGVIAAIVILVILAGLGAFVVSISTSQSITFAQDIQGARAYQAARAGMEWGISRWLNAATCSNNVCSATPPALPCSVDGFAVSVTATPTAGTPAFCTIVSTASGGGGVGSVGYVERQLRAVVESN